MRVRYLYDAKYGWPPGRDTGEMVLAVEDLPPLARRQPIEFGVWFLWEAIGIEVWWCVVPA